MGTPDYRTSGRYVQLARGIRRAIRQKRNDRWIEIHQIINGAQLFELFGEIARGEIGTSATYISRANATDTHKIETKQTKKPMYNTPNQTPGTAKGKPETRDRPPHQIPQHDETSPPTQKKNTGARWKFYEETPARPEKTFTIFPPKAELGRHGSPKDNKKLETSYKYKIYRTSKNRHKKLKLRPSKQIIKRSV